MIIYIDIDETICHSPDVPDYKTSKPIKKNIRMANKLYDQGHYIVYWTARGAKSGIDWSELTCRQLQSWGVKYHEIKFNKPAFDLFIDDKVINSRDWEKIKNN